jgi:hypothetical protein
MGMALWSYNIIKNNVCLYFVKAAKADGLYQLNQHGINTNKPLDSQNILMKKWQLSC